MGYYIEGPTRGKGAYIVNELSATEIHRDEALDYIKKDEKAVVCVVANGIFDAAALIYDEFEYRDFTQPDDYRTKNWFVMDKSVAHALSGYNK